MSKMEEILPTLNILWRLRSHKWKHLTKKEMATHSSTLVWRMPWTKEPGGILFMGSQRVGLDWVTEHTQAIGAGWFSRNRHSFPTAQVSLASTRGRRGAIRLGAPGWPKVTLGQVLTSSLSISLPSKESKFPVEHRDGGHFCSTNFSDRTPQSLSGQSTQ